MKKAAVLIFLVILAGASVSAQSLWTGNAAVGGTLEFEGYESYGEYLGASNSFPAGTRVLVTNPVNDRTLEVLVVKRPVNPGVFLLLTPEAAERLELGRDTVLPVRVQVRSGTGASSRSYTDSPARSPDPDNNPAAASSGGELTTAVIPEDTSADDVLLMPPGTSAGPEESVMKELAGVPAAGTDEEPALVFVAPEEGDVPSAEEDTEVAAAPIPPAEETADEDPADVIYFLTPSDLRPPVAAVTPPDDATTDPDAPAPEAPVDIRPVLVEEEDLADRMVTAINGGRQYIQVGAYLSQEVMYTRIRRIGETYPLVVLPESRDGATIYKLLVGPVTRDEKGQLLVLLRSEGFADSFVYRAPAAP